MLAPTPPMGWNSWDCYGTTVTEAEVMANAEFLAERLLPLGWDTVVVDICWYDPRARSHGYNDGTSVLVDGFGRQVPAPNRFPSAAGGAGFAPLAERVHALGLKLGVHVLRGVPRRSVELDLPVQGTPWTARDIADRASTCPWNADNYGLDCDHAGAQAFYDSQVAQLAAWGVDLVKADDMAAPYHDREIAAYARAISRSGRPIVLGLSPGTFLSPVHLGHLRAHAQMWRVSGDLWDRWDDVHAQFARMARWAPLQQPGGWADADMLPLGRIGIRAERGEDRHSLLDRQEQRTLVTLWVMSRSPLMMGGDLPTSSPETIELLANADVLAVLADSTGNAELLREPLGDDGELVVWGAERRGGGRYAAVFWTGRDIRDVALPLSSLGVPDGATAVELWTGAACPAPVGALQLRLAAHGAALLRLSW